MSLGALTHPYPLFLPCQTPVQRRSPLHHAHPPPHTLFPFPRQPSPFSLTLACFSYRLHAAAGSGAQHCSQDARLKQTSDGVLEVLCQAHVDMWSVHAPTKPSQLPSHHLETADLSSAQRPRLPQQPPPSTLPSFLPPRSELSACLFTRPLPGFCGCLAFFYFLITRPPLLPPSPSGVHIRIPSPTPFPISRFPPFRPT